MFNKYTLLTILILLLLVPLLSISPKAATADTLRWSRVNIPSNGVAGKWVLADGSDVRHLTLASDGTLYCYIHGISPEGGNLFKSADGGYSWSYTGRVEETIVDIAVSPQSPDCVYYATSSGVFKSTDAGDSFTPLSGNPGGAGAGNVRITSIDISSAGGENYVIAATCDSDAGQYGGVYLFVEGHPEGWQDTGLDNYDVCAAAFSPGFAVDFQIAAVATDGNDTVITTNINHAGWGVTINNAVIPGTVPLSALIAFPEDYNSGIAAGKYTQFIALNTGAGNGDVYRIKCQTGSPDPVITGLNAGSGNGTDIASLAVKGNSGNASLMAGAADKAQVYYSADDGNQWSSASRPPSGGSNTCVLMTDSFIAGGTAYAATGGSESAFSVSRDRGATWNQTGLIDTRIQSILDLAISPDYTHDATLFLLTGGMQNSLWYTASSGERWERIYCTSAASGDRPNLVLLSPLYGENRKVWLAGTVNDCPVIWKSEDKGQRFIPVDSVDSSGNPVSVDVWAAAPGDVLFVGSFDGADGLVFRTAPGGLNYIDRGKAGRYPLNALSVSPDYAHDYTILAGNISGSVFISNDRGRVFEPLPLDAAGPPFTGCISVAFDPGFSRNKTVYAASVDANKGIYRFAIGKDHYWQSIDSSLPVGARIGGLAVTASGVLYGINIQTVEKSRSRGGIERSADPLSSSNPAFETVISGLDDGLNLDRLRVQGNNLWTTGWDMTGSRLWTFFDALSSPINLVAPEVESAGLEASNVIISWDPPAGAAAYRWQVHTSQDFPLTPAGLEGETVSSAVKLAGLEAGTKYYWRVRAVQPLASPWSAVRSFETLTPPPPSTPVPLPAPKLTEPKSSTPASITPIFKWTSVEGADRYILQVSPQDDFSVLTIDNTCNASVWQCDTALAYDTGYYWRVKAVREETQSAWSEAGFFVTEPYPLVAPRITEPRSTTPSSITPVFRWNSVEEAEKYELQVSWDDTFGSLFISRICYASVWQCDVSLAYQTSYYCRVRAIRGENQSPWSDVNVFTTGTAPSSSSGSGSGAGSGASRSSLPAAPSLTEPKSNSSCPVSPVFKWTVSEGADQYELLVARDDAFTDIVIGKTGGNACNANVWICDVVLAYSTSYYWKVRAIKEENLSPWSSVGVFKTEAAPTPSPTPTRSTSPAPSASPSPSKTTAPSMVSSPSPSATSPAASITEKPEITTPAGSSPPQVIINQPPPTVVFSSSENWVYILTGSLAALMIVTGVAAVFVIRKGKK